MINESSNVLENFITIETHFGVPNHFIRAGTKNKYSEDFIAIIQEVSKIIYPDKDFEIYFAPPEFGSYKDIIKIFEKNNLKKEIKFVATIGTFICAYLTYKDQHKISLQNQEMRVVDNIQKCLELKKNIEIIKENYDIEGISEEKLSIVCGSLSLKKRKNSIYETLVNDEMIDSSETILKDSTGSSFLSKKIERNEFPEYIELISDQKHYSNNNIEGVIELISPVLKQKKDGRGMTWRGTYYGKDIIFEDVNILKNGEDIDFYMQDVDFKSKISNKERTFAIGDNMKIIFDIAGELKGGIILNRSIYIKEVISYNKEIIPHIEKNNNNQKYLSQNQDTLF